MPSKIDQQALTVARAADEAGRISFGLLRGSSVAKPKPAEQACVSVLNARWRSPMNDPGTWIRQLPKNFDYGVLL
jgi:hypothetical protein